MDSSNKTRRVTAHERYYLTDFADNVTVGRSEHVTTPSSPDDFHGTRVAGEQQHARRHVSLVLDHLHRLDEAPIPDAF